MNQILPPGDPKPILLTRRTLDGSQVARAFETIAQYLPAEALAASWSENSTPWSYFLGDQTAQCFSYFLGDGQRLDFHPTHFRTSRKGAGPMLAAEVEASDNLDWAASVFVAMDKMIHGFRFDQPRAVIMRRRSVIRLGFGKSTQECHYISSPFASWHERIDDADALARDFPGLFRIAQ